MSFFKRLFSSHYRQALQHESAHNLRDAGRCYLMAGDLLSAARVLRVAAREAQDPHDKVSLARQALDALQRAPTEDEDDEADKAPVLKVLSRELADALMQQAEQAGVLDRRSRALVEEAARLYHAHGDLGAAADCHERLGNLREAASCAQAAGDVARMERLLQQVEQAERAEAEWARAWDAVGYAQEVDDPLGLIEALERCLRLRPHDGAISARLADARAQIPKAQRLALKSAHGRWTLVGGDRVRVGREEQNEVLLPDPSVSREHAHLLCEPDGLYLEDRGSSHGTQADGLALRGRAKLQPQGGRLTFGRGVELSYRLTEGHLPARLEVMGGQLKGLGFVWARELTAGQDPDAPAWLPAGLRLVFERGFWHLDPSGCAEPVRANGALMERPRLLRAGDELYAQGVVMVVEL